MNAYPKIWLSSPHMGENEFRYVKEAFDTNWIAPLGPHVNGFEADLSSRLQSNFPEPLHCAVLTSGTAALHLALILLGTVPGDVVLVQSMTFCGTTNPVTYQGAKIVFIDSEADTWNMDPQALESAIEELIQEGYRIEPFDPSTPHPSKPLSTNANTPGCIRAIIPVHLYGMPAQMDRILEIANKHGVPVIEDAAEALGATLNGTPCGAFGTMSVLSFNGNKIITTSGGGALVSPHETLINQARFLSTQARDPAPHYQHSQIGFNYRLSNVSAGIGRGQMEVLDQRVASRRANNQFYRQAFADLPGIRFQNEPEGAFSNYWLTTLLIDPAASGGVTRETVRMSLEAVNIESRPLWKPMHLQPVFADARYVGGKVAETLFEQGLCLPSGSNLSAEDLDRVAARVRSCWGRS